ncbi:MULTISPECIES: hypothetical protein [unclassified Streptomyces]|uniref:hypothetical protein n=1 Tax=unclassified Streptomyces TaxID=2593676 RepID=UPI002365A878|nr:MULTISPECIES: hypothetical protein [unclassified Streptomyces]MDF3141439.1 hypothetical protein [Streptomyces sp. T21Q-yed]WDF40093.1 hypothetical protein PBV52_26565 [Streptomyces sp. T12]
MDPVLAVALCCVLSLFIVATAAVLIARVALDEADSEDRPRILVAAAELVRALRGKR